MSLATPLATCHSPLAIGRLSRSTLTAESCSFWLRKLVVPVEKLVIPVEKLLVPVEKVEVPASSWLAVRLHASRRTPRRPPAPARETFFVFRCVIRGCRHRLRKFSLLLPDFSGLRGTWTKKRQGGGPRPRDGAWPPTRHSSLLTPQWPGHRKARW